MIIGTIIGDIRIAIITRRYGISGRDKPSAANVPNAVARMVEKNPIMIEFFAALTQAELSQTSAHQLLSRGASELLIPKVKSKSYQRVEKPVGSRLNILGVNVK